MRFVFAFVHLAILCAIIPSHAHARTRSPKTENERSLLYWRYLCENQSQTETANPIELHCLSQSWKVVADGDLVREVVEDAKK